jgi:thymidylate kinase
MGMAGGAGAPSARAGTPPGVAGGQQAGLPVESVALLEAAFAASSAAGVRWLVLRGDAGTVGRGGDVDLLVQAGAAGRLAAGLQGLGFAVVPSAGQGSHRFLLGYDQQAGLWVRLDLTERVEFGRYHQLTSRTAARLLARRVAVDGHWRLCADDAFWHLLLHRLLSTGELASEELVQLARQARVAGPLAGLAERAGRGAGCGAQQLLELVAGRRWQQLEELRPLLVRGWHRQHLAVELVAGARNGVERISQALRSLVWPSGISAAIIGPDGAGKTTLAQGLRATLPVASSYVYMGVWRQYPWDRWLRWLPGTRLAQRLLRLLVRSAQARWQRARGRVVLLDRFTYDVLLPSPGLDWRGRVTVALVRRVGAEPQLVLVLDAPAEVMFARKGEQGIEELKRRRASYLEVVRSRPDSAVIDATQPPQAVREQAQQLIWARLRQHWDQLT